MTLQTLDQLRKLREELPGVMEEVIQLFISDSPEQMREIDAAYARSDRDALRQAAHYLRSGALALRLEWVAEQAHRVEFLAPHSFGKPSSERLLTNLREELDGAVVALRRELSEQG